MAFDWTFILSVYGLATCFAGAGLGIIWGALPGLSVTMAMALLVGLTYTMPASLSIIFMIAVWTGAEFGGAISAILLNMPGTPSAVPTQLAGYPLAKRGEGGLAIGTALTFSMLGNWAGLFVLLLLAPVMIALALNFSSWEMFLLVTLGISISGSLTSGERPVKGWAMGCLGMLISMVGKDLIHGVDRFTFNISFFNAGIHYLPILIGLFGLAEALKVLNSSTPKSIPAKMGRLLPPLSFVMKYWQSALRSSAVGTFIGAIPGVGANIASYVSYSLGEQFTGRRFSRGDFEGVVCSEVANNANIGGGLLPTITLGIPGNSSSALIIASLALHGVVLGPTIESDQPGFLLFLYVALLLANIFMYLSALALIRPSIYLLSMPAGVVMPSVLMFCLIGTFAASYSSFDVAVMFVAGIIGFILNRQNYPFAPLVLGALLGPTADENLRRSILVNEGHYVDMLLRPIGLVLMIVIIWSIYYGITRSTKTARRPYSTDI
ncbi:MAG: hypothetical protein DHS20C01_32940 [marine bacterium B5-7]|nr:MAG: hypothetical protein DHS20C01_32940 [marine bacterium B5-7]